MMWTFLVRAALLFSLAVCTCQQNTSAMVNESCEKSSHYIVRHFGWQALSGLGVVGTILNIFLLHTFYIERKALATSVNAMICGELTGLFMSLSVFTTCSWISLFYTNIWENTRFTQYKYNGACVMSGPRI